MREKVLRAKNVHFHQRLKCSLGKQLPALDPGKGKLPGFSARKSDCKTRAENRTNKILEFYPNSCSSPSRSPDSLGSDGCCDTKCKASPPAAKTAHGTEEEQCSPNGSRKQNSLPPPNCLLCCETVTVPLRRD